MALLLWAFYVWGIYKTLFTIGALFLLGLVGWFLRRWIVAKRAGESMSLGFYETPLVFLGACVLFLMAWFTGLDGLRWWTNWSRERELAQSLEATRKAVREENERTAPQRLAAARAAQEAQQAEEDARWATVDVAGCREPKTTMSCAPLETFIASYPNSRHLDEARQVLEEAKPKLEVVVDHSDWESADAQTCKTATSTNACDRVEEYLRRYPNGAHVKEAKATIAIGSPKVERIRSAERKKRAQFAEQYGKKIYQKAFASGTDGKDLVVEGTSGRDCKLSWKGVWAMQSDPGRDAKRLGFEYIRIECRDISKTCLISLAEPDRRQHCD